MARGVGDHGGGIRGLVQLLNEHGEAVEYELIRLGLRRDWLGTDLLSWRDLLVIVRCAPRDSPLRMAVDPASRQTIEIDLLRSIEYSLHWLRWAKTEDAPRGRNAPQPITWPWEPHDSVGGKADVMTVDEMAARLGWDRR